MKTKSCKAKGRRLQNHVRDCVREFWCEDARVRIMGEKGDDVYVDSPDWSLYVECRNRQSISIWSWMDKISKKCGDKFPLLVIKKNHKEPLVVIKLMDFFTFTKINK